MSIDSDDILEQAHTLRRNGEPFALATVVRVTRPASARPGAKAIVRADGAITGWVGGSCAQALVAQEALAALGDGQPRLLCLVGVGGLAPERTQGMIVRPMTCHSGGTLEIYIEPFVPRPRLLIVGRSPVAEALAQLGTTLHYSVAVVDAAAQAEHFPTANILLADLRSAQPLLTPQSYVVVATHGAYDEEALRLALDSDAAYVALVASRRRAEAIVAYLRDAGVAEERLVRLKAPAGLDLGAVEPAEIALSIMAEIIRTRRNAPAAVEASPAPSEPELPTTAIDPVCGMTVDITTARYIAEHEGQRFYFCCAGCQHTFEREPARYLVVRNRGVPASTAL
jgi:xanthine dehydrogenase accessory factor